MRKVNRSTSRLCRRNILLLIGNTGASRRAFLSGFGYYARERPQWTTNLREMSEFGTSAAYMKMMAGEYDGIIVDDESFRRYPEIADIADIPIIVFGARQKLKHSKSLVVFLQNDNVEIGACGAEYLIGNGNYRTFAFVQAPNHPPWSTERGQGFLKMATQHGKTVEVFNPSDKLRLDQWLSKLAMPTGLMAANDGLALEVLECCHQIEIDVPHQLAILGVDNDELLCEYSAPSISSIQPAHEQAGFMSAKILNRLFRGWNPKEPKHVLTRGITIATRESTAPVSPAAALIKAAITVIAQNSSSALTPDDVSRKLHVSRALLDLRFRQFEKKTVSETIKDYRLEAVKKYLLTTKLSVKRIAALMGFPNISYLEVLFKQKYGLPMNRWRMANSVCKNSSCKNN